MIVKLFEIRDSATFIPMLAIKLGSKDSEANRYLLSCAGFGLTHSHHSDYVLLAEINGGNGRICCCPGEWNNSRTFYTAHIHICQHFDELESGDVIDVEFILGETKTKKMPERLS